MTALLLKKTWSENKAGRSYAGHDSRCELAESCLNCPLELCRYDRTAEPEVKLKIKHSGLYLMLNNYSVIKKGL